MQLWDGTIDADGHRSAATQMREYADGEYHGHRPDVEHYAVRHVPVISQPDGGIGHCCGIGYADTDALCASYHGTVGTTGTGEGHEHASPH